jgi:hypothetical protein
MGGFKWGQYRFIKLMKFKKKYINFSSLLHFFFGFYFFLVSFTWKKIKTAPLITTCVRACVRACVCMCVYRCSGWSFVQSGWRRYRMSVATGVANVLLMCC